MSQRALGKMVGLTGAEIGFLENKKRDLTLAVFIDICKALKRHPMYFLEPVFPAKKQDLFVTKKGGRVMREAIIMLRKHLKKVKVLKKSSGYFIK